MEATNNDEESAPGYIDWANSEAKQIILEDLEEGWLPLDASEVPPRVAWDLVYSHLPAFIFPSLVPYEQFVARLRDHRRLIKKRKERASLELELLNREREMYPRATHNNRGELVFDMLSAKKLLRKDVKDKKHEQMTPSELKKTRPEYKPFSAKKFKHRIYQEVRYQKMVNYMEEK